MIDLRVVFDEKADRVEPEYDAQELQVKQIQVMLLGNMCHFMAHYHSQLISFLVICSVDKNSIQKAKWCVRLF
jgi:hypothetical protein